MSFDKETLAGIRQAAKSIGVEWEALAAIALTESNGRLFATVKGRQEPVIRYEGHYFWRRTRGSKRDRAFAQKLAHPKAGRIRNTRSQEGRWKILARAAKINHQAAYESVSWGLGQVMGSHWKHLGYSSVDALVKDARSGVAGQVRLMARFIKKNGLVKYLKTKDWAGFARRYNGPGYRKNRYDKKMAKAYAGFKRGHMKLKMTKRAGAKVNENLRYYQKRLIAIANSMRNLDFHPGKADGKTGPKTRRAIEYSQRTDDSLINAAIRHKKVGQLGPRTNANIEKLYEHFVLSPRRAKRVKAARADKPKAAPVPKVTRKPLAPVKPVQAKKRPWWAPWR